MSAEAKWAVPEIGSYVLMHGDHLWSEVIVYILPTRADWKHSIGPWYRVAPAQVLLAVRCRVERRQPHRAPPHTSINNQCRKWSKDHPNRGLLAGGQFLVSGISTGSPGASMYASSVVISVSWSILEAA